MENPTASPSKRRALAPLDANALPSPKPVGLGPKQQQQQQQDTSPLRKRAVEASAVAAGSPRPEKRTCTEQQDATRSRSGTPDDDDDESSLFDNNDASWASNTTPDVSPAPRVLTREQAREKAEVLRLRLGLASYKVRTGQTSVPLADLVAKPLPRQAGRQSRRSDRGDEGEGGRRRDEDGEEQAEAELPRLRHQTVAGEDGPVATPRRKEVLRVEEDEERLTSSALRGGAASGLLSLARGGSAE